MSVTTSSVFNQDKFDALLPAGTTYGWTGVPFEAAGSKTIAATCSDAQLQTAVTTAASTFVDRKANYASLLTKASAALTANDTFLAIANPTAAQVATQTKALTRQVNLLLRIVANQLDSTGGT